MVLTEDEFPIVSIASHAVVEEAKAAGVYVFGGGIQEDIEPVLVSPDGLVSTTIFPGSHLTGGLLVLELTTPQEAHNWAKKIALACRCPQEVREFRYDPQS